MNNIAQAFQGKKAFIAYLMGGDPGIPETKRFILAMQEAGADLIEIGIPFSDPIAEGEVIQRANLRAAGVTVDHLFDMLEEIRDAVRVPLVFLTYANPVFTYGYQGFFARCRRCGVAGIIVPDMPFEEQGEMRDVAQGHGVELITLVAPTSRDRIEKIAREARGFIYLVSSMGVTGVRSEITTDIAAVVQGIRQYTDTPVAVGFGISSPEQAARFAREADGAIVGSAIVKIIEEHGAGAEGPLRDYVRSMKAAME